MKKLFLMIALVGIAVSCTKDDSASVEANQTQVAFNITLPQTIHSKAISDGLSATELTYAVYRNGEHLSHLDPSEPVTMSGRKATVKINLVKNAEYKVVFWAQTPNNPYYAFDKTAGTITVDYDGNANDESRDAFYRSEPVTITSSFDEIDVMLRRPFAQINFWALKPSYDEVVDLGFTAMESDFDVVANVPNVLNVVDESVSGATPVSFTQTAIPHLSDNTLYTYQNNEYVRVAMNYILASNDDAANSTLNLSADFYYNNEYVSVPVTDVNYKRNYRTNILGNFFTGETTFNVTIVQDYFDNDGDGKPDDFIESI